ncbi:hypothetical protein PR048_004938, partial [Dryococelus australis]
MSRPCVCLLKKHTSLSVKQYRTMVLNCLITMGQKCPTPQVRPRAMSNPCFRLPQQPKKYMRPAVMQYRTLVLNRLITTGQKCPTQQARPRAMYSPCLCLPKQISPLEKLSAGKLQTGTEPLPPLEQDKADMPCRSDILRRRELPPCTCRINFKNQGDRYRKTAWWPT